MGGPRRSKRPTRARWAAHVLLGIVAATGVAGAGDEKPTAGDAWDAVGRSVAAMVRDQRIDALRARFDAQAFTRRATEGLGLSAAEVAELGSTMTVDALFGDMFTTLRAGGRYDYVGVRVVEGGTQVLLFRFVGSPQTSTTGWQGFLFEATESAGPRFVDVYVFTAGRFLSNTLRAKFATLTSPHADLLLQLSDAYGRLDSARMEEISAKLPEDVRSGRDVLQMREDVALQSGDRALYGRLLRQHLQLHPDDPSILFKQRDLAIMEGRWEESLKHLDAIDELLADPYLRMERAAACLQLRWYAEASRALDEYLASQPPTPEALVMRAASALGSREFETAADVLDRFERLTGKPGTLNPTTPNYEEFQRWRAERRGETSRPFQGTPEEFARELEADLAEQRTDLLRGAVDTDEVVLRVARGLPDAALVRRALTAETLRTALTQLVLMVSGEGAHWRFLGMRPMRGETWALYRVAGHGILFYFGLALRTGPDGTIRVVDTLNGVTGDSISDSIRNEVLVSHREIPLPAGMRELVEAYGRMVGLFQTASY
jgi:hypothetical protein